MVQFVCVFGDRDGTRVAGEGEGLGARGQGQGAGEEGAGADEDVGAGGLDEHAAGEVGGEGIVLPVRHPNLSLLFSLLLIVSGWSVGVATAILLWYRDVGLGLIGWGLVILFGYCCLAGAFRGT